MVSYKIKFCPFLVPSSNNIIDISFLIIYVLSPFTKNWNIGSIRECGMGSGFSCSRRQSVTAARRSSTMDEGPRAAQSGSENHFLVASTVIACWSKIQRSQSLQPSDIKLVKSTDNAALETTSCFRMFWLALFRFCKINDQQRRDVK